MTKYRIAVFADGDYITVPMDGRLFIIKDGARKDHKVNWKESLTVSIEPAPANSKPFKTSAMNSSRKAMPTSLSAFKYHETQETDWVELKFKSWEGMHETSSLFLKSASQLVFTGKRHWIGVFQMHRDLSAFWKPSNSELGEIKKGRENNN